MKPLTPRTTLKTAIQAYKTEKSRLLRQANIYETLANELEKDFCLAKVDLENLEPECHNLVVALNALEGIATFKSCWGHDKDPFRIWFQVSDLDNSGLLLLLRTLEPCSTTWCVRLALLETSADTIVHVLEGPIGPSQKAEELANALQKLVSP
jgi:hypothetical protein